MTLQTAPAYLGSENFQHPANLDRDIIRRLTGKKTGVFDIDDFVVAPTTGLNVTVTGGAVSMLGTDAPTSQGHYFAWSDATEVIAAVPAHASLKRIDALVLRVIDSAYSGGFTQGAVWEWVSGTAASSPAAPTDGAITAIYRPGSWFRVANVQINNGDTVVDPARIFDTRYFTTNANGLQYAATSAARIAIVGLQRGDRVYQIDTDATWTWDGTYWLPQVGTCVARLNRTLATTFTQGTVVGFDAEDWDTLSGHDNVTNNSRWTSPIPGKFTVTLGARHQAATDGAALTARILKNGTGVGLLSVQSANSSPSLAAAWVHTDTVQCVATNYLEGTVGNNLATNVNAQGAFMTVTYAGA